MAVSSAFQVSYAQSSQPEAIDLGLSVKWADRNLGASSPKGYGDYYAWGETSPKSHYSWNTYIFCTDTLGHHFNKYVPLDKPEYWSGSGSSDNKTCLDLSDDAARAQLGGKWRLPTKAEWEELRDKCTWSQRGKKGYKVTGPNGRSIFLPAAGIRVDSLLKSGGAVYWSSSLDTDRPYYAWECYFGGDHMIGMYIRLRCYGYSVRPVMD